MRYFTKRKVTIVIVFLIMIILCREFLWKTRATSYLDENIKIKIVYTPHFVFGIDPMVTKKIIVENIKTENTLKIEIISLEWDLKFFVEKTQKNENLKIADMYLGQNTYNYETLNLDPNTEDCFNPELNYCGGFSEKAWKELGNSNLYFDGDNFEK
ncbi:MULTISPECIES: hypothetical protein [Aquimarina]|uniref:hypothetical protein n=1 Tax=Aquimarina TaxID=290174 RepID=UPI0010499484|nr:MULTISPECIES: hypothetical protein [Aquimarina]